MVILINKNNKDTLEMSKLELNKKIKMLEYTSKYEINKVSSIKFFGLYTVGLYRKIINYYRKEYVRIVMSRDLLYTHAKDIMVMLASANIVKKWDERFWDCLNGMYVPRVNNIIKYLENRLEY